MAEREARNSAGEAQEDLAGEGTVRAGARQWMYDWDRTRRQRVVTRRSRTRGAAPKVRGGGRDDEGDAGDGWRRSTPLPRHNARPPWRGVEGGEQPPSTPLPERVRSKWAPPLVAPQASQASKTSQVSETSQAPPSQAAHDAKEDATALKALQALCAGGGGLQAGRRGRAPPLRRPRPSGRAEERLAGGHEIATLEQAEAEAYQAREQPDRDNREARDKASSARAHAVDGAKPLRLQIGDAMRLSGGGACDPPMIYSSETA